MNIMLDITLSAQSFGNTSASGFSYNEKPDFQSHRQNIIDRNLFNSDGIFPVEEENFSGAASGEKKFDLNAACNRTSLKVELVGTIYTGNQQTSIATVREAGIESADVYRVGDEIIEGNGAKVAQIEQRRLILNNNGIKECIELKDQTIVASNFAAPISDSLSAPSPNTLTGGPVEGGNSNSISLSAAFVEAELGPGFSKIIQAARMVPNSLDASMNGFKVFGIRPGSLMSKIFREGDILTQVNDANLSQPDQGFALYQAFQDEREIRIYIVRGGEKVTVQVQVN